MDTVNKYRTYALTIRPKDGVTDKHVSECTEWIRKRCSHYHIVTEKTGSERHIHAALYLLKDVTRSNLCTLLCRLGKKLNLTNEENVVLRNGVKIMYNNDFIENYLDKDDDTEVIATSLPEMGNLQSWYPPKPAQVNGKKIEKHSRYYWELESLWKQHTDPLFEVHTRNARNFLFDMMYNKRLIPVIRDDKQIVQTARHLVRWIKKEEYSTIELAPFEKEE